MILSVFLSNPWLFIAWIIIGAFFIAIFMDSILPIIPKRYYRKKVFSSEIN
jgi:hypothetical protein